MNIQRKFRHPWLLLGLLVVLAAGVLVRAPGVDWLAGDGPRAEFTFHPDDHRFLGSARNFAERYPDGYVMGMAAQLYVALSVAEWFGPVNASRLMRTVSQGYAAVTLWLLYLAGRALGAGRLASVLACAFLAVAPMHVANSNFGTPDVTLLAYFYTAFLCAAHWLRTRREGWFLATWILAGATLALKFFLPSLALAGTALLLSPERAAPWRYVAATFLGISGFFVFSLFNYTIWEFMPLMRMLLFDNVIVPGGHSPPMQVVKYAGDVVVGMGTPIGLLVAAGAAVVATRARALIGRLSLRTPPAPAVASLPVLPHPLPNVVVLAVALASHAALIVTASIHGPRHALVFLPVACLLAGVALEAGLQSLRWRWPTATAAVLLLGYGTYNAIATQAMYTHDLRHDMAAWARPLAAGGKRVVSLIDYSRVAGSEQAIDHEDVRRADFFLTCDIEFRRYFKATDASDVHHAYGQGRLEFYRALFEGREAFVVDRAFVQRPTSLELSLIEQRRLPPYGLFIPRRCVAFRRVDAPPGVADPRAMDAVDLAKNSW